MGAYYVPKLIFSHDFPVEVGDAYYIRACIVFKFLQYALLRNHKEIGVTDICNVVL